MSAESTYRLAVIVITAIVLTAIAWWGGLLDGPPPTPRTEDGVPVIDEQLATRLLPRLATNDKIEFDPVAIVRPRADYSLEMEWAEHPDGRFLMETNGQGFREDGPVATAFEGTRIVVLGDSHPFGLCNNRESLANLLEVRLAQRDDGPYDVVNAAVSGTGPYEYLGNLKKQLALGPDLVVAMLFTGNDLRNALLFADALQGRQRRGSPVDKQVIASLPPAWLEPMGQGFNQALEFHHRPDDGERAVLAAAGRFADMAALCAARGVAFLAVTLPTKPDVDLTHDRYRAARILEALQLSAEDYGVNRRLGLRFTAALRERGIEVLDLFDAMRAHDTPLYWARDYHLGVAGHAFVARELQAPVLELLGR